MNSTSITRKKLVQLPLTSLVVSNKMSYIKAINTFNKLQYNLRFYKTLERAKKIERKYYVC